MSKRRTRAQKMAADQKKAETTPQITTSGPQLQPREIRRDLTRSLIVTILALFLQISLKLFLERR